MISLLNQVFLLFILKIFYFLYKYSFIDKLESFLPVFSVKDLFNNISINLFFSVSTIEDTRYFLFFFQDKKQPHYSSYFI